MDLMLTGKVAAITGGSQGIGLAVAQGLAKEGVHVALCARHGEKTAHAAAEIAATYGVRAIGMAVDVTRSEDIARFVGEVEQTFGGVDILFNNAGLGTNETILDAPDEKWDYYWNLHVMAAVRLSRSVTPMMRARGGGVIINNASICATQPLDFEPIYNTTKAALAMMGKCLANELIGDNIRVNTLNAGLIYTPGWTEPVARSLEGTGTTVDDYLNQIAREYTPIKRFASSEEVADFVVFLCSPKASYCVGSSYYVDGGWLKVVN
jgi:NAD(P)-dependent dehydrogenase (short-subunit alcohol dehydrogenase family)